MEVTTAICPIRAVVAEVMELKIGKYSNIMRQDYVTLVYIIQYRHTISIEIERQLWRRIIVFQGYQAKVEYIL